MNKANFPPALLRLIAAGCPDRASKKLPDTEPSLNNQTREVPQFSAEGSGYTITDLGFSSPNGINVYGQVVGGDFNGAAFLWTKIHGMQTLAGIGSFAYDINDFGEVIGQFEQAGCAPPCNHTFLWTKAGGIEDLNQQLFAVSRINDRGQIAGVDGFNHATVLTKANGIEDLGTLGGSASEATDLNNFGQVVGSSSLSGDNESHAFLWSKATGMEDLGSLGGNSFASGINDFGQVVGESCTDSLCSSAHVFLWTRFGGMQDLGTLPGGDYAIPKAINDRGQVVGGACIDSPCYYEHAFLWTREDGMQDLNDKLPSNSGYELTYAFDINLWGQTVGFAMIPDGVVDGVVLTPHDRR
jgi:probable HAF family extracellular repeat protein